MLRVDVKIADYRNVYFYTVLHINKRDRLKITLQRNHMTLGPSIHYLVLLSGAGSWWQPAKQGPPGFLLPRHALQFLLGDPEAFPGQKRYIIPPAGSGSAPGSPPSWTCPENLQGEAPGGHPNQTPEPSQLTPFDAEEQRLYSDLPLDV